MASLFTNASAQTALKTLTAASSNLSKTQNRVSTGLRIGAAEDNAAYWSIATTLRSDVGALGAVKDALGLGAATIDTVYTGINDTKDLLDQVKSKLVAASQTGVPRAQVQAEISQLQNRLKDTSKSTVINSESWLTQDSSATGYSSNKDVVGSFTRAGGVVTIENITIDINQTKLYENSVSIKKGVEDALNTAGATALAAYKTDVDAITGAFEARRTAALALVDSLAMTPATGAIAAVTNFTSAVTHNDDTPTAGVVAAVVAAFTTNNSAAGLLDSGDATALTNAINKELTALGFATDDTGKATNLGSGALQGLSTENAADRALIAEALAKTKTAIKSLINTTFDATSTQKYEAAQSNYRALAASDDDNAKLGIFDKVRAVASSADGTSAKAVSVANIDISKLTDTAFDKTLLSTYISVVDDALQELTLSASVIGAAKARVEGNKTFVQNLIDANNRGIGQLVDADLNEESTKLKALQVQEQLAIQALGIANGSTQNILSLFQ